MSIVIQTPSDQTIKLDSRIITIGSDPGCDVVLPNDGQVRPRHAKIKMVVNRWMIESEGDWPIRVGNGVPGRKCWLKPGDEIHLTESGATIVFDMAQPSGGQAAKAADAGLPPRKMQASNALSAQSVATTGATRAAASPKLPPPPPKSPPPLPPDAAESPPPLSSGPPPLPKSEEAASTTVAQSGTQRTSAPSPHANAPVSPDSATLRRKIEGLTQSLVQQVLTPQADLPNIEPIATFRDEHDRLQTQLKQTKHRLQELEQAKAQYEPLDNAYQQKAKELAAAEANLKQVARPLGKAAFEALVAGHVQSQPIFNDRLAINAKIGELQTEHDRIASPSDAGMVQKTKAKAQQLVVAGKIKLEKMKVGGLEEQIGGQLIVSNQEESVRCGSTADILAELARQRSVIAQRRQEYERAREALDQEKQKLAQSLQMASIEGSKSLDIERRNCETQIAEIEKQRSVLEKQLPERLLACGPLDGSLGELLRDLRDVQAQLDAAPATWNPNWFGKAAGTWRGLDTKRKVITAVCGFVGASFFLCCGMCGVFGVFLPHNQSGENESRTTTDNGNRPAKAENEIARRTERKGSKKTTNLPSEFAETEDWYFENDWWQYRVEKTDPLPEDKGLLHRFEEIPNPVQQAVKERKEVWHVPGVQRTESKPVDMDVYLIATGQRTGVFVCAKHVTDKDHGDLNWWEKWLVDKPYKAAFSFSTKSVMKERWKPEFGDAVCNVEITQFWNTYVSEEGRNLGFSHRSHDQNYTKDDHWFLITIAENGKWDSLFKSEGIAETSEVRRGVARRLK